MKTLRLVFTLMMLLSLEQKSINHTHHDSFLLSDFSLLFILPRDRNLLKLKMQQFDYSKRKSRKAFPITCAQLPGQAAALGNTHPSIRAQI